jgi:sugar/nucleoside kinase (ribokinase family)
VTGRIVVFGDVIDDIVVVPSGPIRADTDTPSSIRHRAGGSAANVASWLGHTGVGVDFVGRVAASDVLKHSSILRAFGVTPHLEGDEELPTGTIVIIVDGNSRSMLTERGANDRFSADAVTDELLAGAALVHFTGYSIYHGQNQDAIARLFAWAAAEGVAVSVDPASAGSILDFGAERFLDLVARATALVPNLEEGRVLTGRDDPFAIAASLAERFPLVALTLGNGGVLIAEPGAQPVLVEAVPAPAVDPTGAGDAFTAGFLAEWARHGDALAAARAGVALAARAVTVVGGRPPV